ncbi:MAG: fumarylacetoacetate hydrolase family protein [Alteromonadaceae bacterium]|nr:fumarylacetoacetate hydrolase family protein [Alteromonadaceae bacterium]
MNTINIDGKPLSPSKLVCIGRNYAEHITELGNEVPDEMVVFNKPNSAISERLLSFHGEQLHYEAELCFVFQRGKFCAVGFGLDLTKRSLQSKLKDKGLPWERAKAFDGSAVFSDFVVIESLDYVSESALSLELAINDKVIQAGGVELMMYKPEQVLKELQTFMTLEDGDVVMTGTPKGVGVINAGDNFIGKVLLAGKIIISAEWQAK